MSDAIKLARSNLNGDSQPCGKVCGDLLSLINMARLYH